MYVIILYINQFCLFLHTCSKLFLAANKRQLHILHDNNQLSQFNKDMI